MRNYQNRQRPCGDLPKDIIRYERCKKVELLAPRSMEKLKIALTLAQTRYMGGYNFSLRQYSQNFSHEEIFEAAQYTHNLGKSYMSPSISLPAIMTLPSLKNILRYSRTKVDAVIVSDLGVGFGIENTRLDVHISTQANTTNARAIDFYAILA